MVGLQFKLYTYTPKIHDTTTWYGARIKIPGFITK